MGFLNRLLGKESVSEDKQIASPQDIIANDSEIIACIAAVAAYMLNTGKKRFVIKRIEANNAMIWSFAGRQESMNAKLFLR